MPLAFAPGAHLGKADPVGTIQMLWIAAHLGADVALSDRVRVASADGHDAPVLDAHIQAAGIRTIERAGAYGPRRTGCPGRTQVHQRDDSNGSKAEPVWSADSGL